MKDIMDRAMAAERDGEVLNACVFGGSALSDIPHVGLTVLLVADAGQRQAAQQLLDELTQMAWARRADFVYPIEPMAHARTLEGGPIGDNCGAGGSADQMAVLAQVMRQGLDDVVAGPFCDPAAVAKMIVAGVDRADTGQR